jgi:hypothetical protein
MKKLSVSHNHVVKLYSKSSGLSLELTTRKSKAEKRVSFAKKLFDEGMRE